MTQETKDQSRPGKGPSGGGLSGLLVDKRYRILRLLGEGGMGAVYLAEHVGLRTHVAVKFLHVDLARQSDAVKRFEQEARVAASIRHPNIIQVFDVGVGDGGDPFLVMEYLEGESLAGLMKRAGPLGLDAACGVVEPVLQALQAAHRKRIIHRDLKPDNIFLVHQPDEPPIVKIIDFGLSKFTTGATDQLRTQTGSVMGTPAYMSPEQARGSAGLDHRTDLYSIGTILFEILTRQLPYAGSNFHEFFANMLTEEPRDPMAIFPGFPVEAGPLVRKAIRKNPDERFQTATEMLEALGTLPGFDARAKALAEASEGLRRSSFAAGDLGQGEWHPMGMEATSEPADRPEANREVETGETVLAASGRASSVQANPRRGWALWGGLVLGGATVATLGSILVLGARPGKVAGSDPSPTGTGGSMTSVAHESPRVADPAHGDAATLQPAAPTVVKAPPRAAGMESAPAADPVVEVDPGREKRPRAGKDAASGKKRGHAGAKGLQRGARGTQMSEQFE